MRSSIVVVLLGILSSGYLSADSPSGNPFALIPVTNNFVHFPGAYSYQAPVGWSVELERIGFSRACDLKGANDCVAMIMAAILSRDTSLREFAQDQLDFNKKMDVKSNVQMGDMLPFDTTSGWEGFKVIETVTTNGAASQNTFYFFAGHGDDKIMMETSCHSEALDHYTPIFDDAIKTLVRD